MSVELSGSDLVLALGRQHHLVVVLLADLLVASLHLLLTLLVVLLTAQDVRLKQLVLSLDLLIVLLHGLEALHEVVDGEGVQLNVWRIQICYLVAHL